MAIPRNLQIKSHDRTDKSVRINPVMIPRKRTANKERTMSFLNKDDHFVNAFIPVDLDGNPVQLNALLATQEAILDELRELNHNLRKHNV